MRRMLLVPLAALALILAVAPGRAADKDTIAEDEKRLKACHIATDGASLVEFLKTRAKGEVFRATLVALLKDLEGSDIAKRQKAFAELVSIGAPAVPMLRTAAREIDTPELSGLAKAALKAVEEDPGALTAAAVRLLAARLPAGTATALLDFLPHSETDAVLDEMKNVLSGVAYSKGKADPVILKALSDPHPLRRATAITALCAGGGGIGEHRLTFRKLLSDPKPSVRLQASLALGRASDPKAVSTLITLLPDLPMEQVKQIEEFLMELAGELAPKVPITEDVLGREKARDAWARWWLDTEGPGLITELSKRTLSEKELGDINGLIEKLGDDSFDDREAAETALKKMGAKILPLLRNAKNHADLEVRKRSQGCVEAIEADKTPPLSVVSVRLMALRKPKGGAEAIIAYMPFADDESMIDELQASLNAITHEDGKPHAAVVKAVYDKYASRRAAAAQALCAGPLTEPIMKAIRDAMKDKDPNVRAKTALALAGAKEPEAMPVLFKLLEDGPVDWVGPVEEYLAKVARDAGPKDLPDGDDNRKKRAAAWGKWWDDNKGKVELVSVKAVLEEAGPRLAVMAVQDNMTGMTKLFVLDHKGERKHTITSINYPNHASMAKKDRVLICDQNSARIVETDLKGDIKWQKQFNNPIGVYPQRNGGVFVVTRNQLFFLDGAQKEVRRIDRPGFDIMSAAAFADGTVSLLTNNGQLVRYGKDGKQTGSVSLAMGGGRRGFVNNLPLFLKDGGVIMPDYFNGQVKAYDKAGKEKWSTSISNPWSVAPMPGGGYMVTTRAGNNLYELDKNGKQKKTTAAEGIPLFYDRR